MSELISDDDSTLLCSDCFEDEGLRIDAYKIGFESSKECSNCKSKDGKSSQKSLSED